MGEGGGMGNGDRAPFKFFDTLQYFKKILYLQWKAFDLLYKMALYNTLWVLAMLLTWILPGTSKENWYFFVLDM